MREKLILYVIILLVSITILEIIFSKILKLKIYNFKDTIGNLIQGLGQQSINIILFTAIIAIYEYIYSHFSIFNINQSQITLWILIIFLADLCFYIGHKSSHNINIFIATHIVHHQTKDFNHGSALRQSWTGRLGMTLFYLPLAIIGFPTEMLIVAQLGIMVIQFLSHNGILKSKLGPLEYLFVTPSSHRIHHGINSKYISKNCGGMFIIWDKLFNTYAEEDEPIIYGIKSELNYYNPINANTDYFKRIFFVFHKRVGLINKIKILFQSPSILEKELIKYNYNEIKYKNISGNITPLNKLKILILTTLSISILVVSLARSSNSTIIEKIITITLVIIIISFIGKLLNLKTSSDS